jgi:hypothetical protein
MAAHGNNIEPQPRQGRPNLSHPDRVAMMRQREEIRHLPETDCPALAPDCERMHRPAVSETCERTTHALARDLYAIRNLPEVVPQQAGADGPVLP